MATILVVDDEPDALSLLRAWLNRHEYDVLTAANAEQAFRAAQAQLPDLILLDVMLPDEDGITLCKRLRANAATSHIPIVLITAYDPSVGRAAALMAGANDYVTKPLILPDLLSRLDVLLMHDRRVVDQGQRLLKETVHTALVILPCNLAWLLSMDTRSQKLVSQVIATSEGDKSTLRFMQQVFPSQQEATIPLDPADNLLAQVAVSSSAVFNLPLSNLRDRISEPIYRACESLDLYFVSVLPVQIAGTPQGVMLLGSRTPRDVETVRGQQLMTSIMAQAAMAIHNSELLKRLSEREVEAQHERAFRQALIDTMPDGLTVYDTRGRIKYANQRLKRMMDLGEPWRIERIEELFAEEDRHRVSPSLYQPPVTETHSLELNLLRADGTTLPVLAVQAGQSITSIDGGDERVMVLTDLSEQKLREQALARQTRRLRGLNRASQAITSTLSLDETIQRILAEASSVHHAVMASVLLSLPDSDRLAYRAVFGPNSEKVIGRRVRRTGALAQAIREMQPIIEADISGQQDARHPVEMLTGMAVRSQAVAPLVVDDQVLGVVELLHDLPDGFGAEDLDVMEGLARAAAIALSNARLYAEARRHVREMMLMIKASETASSTLTIGHVVEMIAHQLLDALSAHWCMVSYWDKDSDRLVHLAEVAEVSWRDGELTIDLADYPAVARALKVGEPFILAVNESDAPSSYLAGLSLPRPSSLLQLPIQIDGKIVGLAKVSYLGEDETFDRPDVERCQTAMHAWSKALPEGAEWTDAENVRELGASLLSATGAARCAICKHLPDENTLTCLHEMGKVISPMGQGPEVPLSDTGLRRVALLERTPVSVRVGETERLPVRPPSFPGVNSGWRLIAPLIARGEAIGLVEIINVNSEQTFSRSEMSLAQAIGGVVGNALENARLYSTVLRRAAQLEAAYNDLREMDRHKSEWIQNVSHELRTPLTSIIGYVDLLLGGDFGPLTDDQVDGIRVISTKARHLARIFDDILMIQNVEASDLDLELASVPEIALSAIEAVQPHARRIGIEISIDVDEDVQPIYCDRGYIEQVFDNLLENAIKFSPNGGHIHVVIEDRSVALRVTVSDEGIGISPEEQEKIWWRFYQVDGSMTRQYGGTGLGLAIVKEVVEKHEGRAWVESEPGEGSSFIFVLPKLQLDELKRMSKGIE